MRNYKAFKISMVVFAHDDAEKLDVEDLLMDLSWVGGCRHPNDPRFDGLITSEIKVTRSKSRDRLVRDTDNGIDIDPDAEPLNA